MDFITLPMSEKTRVALRVYDIDAIVEGPNSIDGSPMVVVTTRTGKEFTMPDPDRTIRDLILDAERGYGDLEREPV
jgi:hypothetical protein